MARVMIEEVIGHLDKDLRKALATAVVRLHPSLEIDERALFREFQASVSRRCDTWERVPARYVDCS